MTLPPWFRYLWIPIVLAAVTGAVLIATPYTLQRLTRQWLLDHGADQVYFEDVDFNPFSGRLVLRNLKVRVDDQTTLKFDTVSADLAWLPLWHKQVLVEGTIISGFAISIDARHTGRPLIGGIQLPPADTNNPSPQAGKRRWAAGIGTLLIKNSHLHYRAKGLDLRLALNALKLGSLARWSGEQSAPITARGTLNQAPFRLQGSLAPLAHHPHYHAAIKLDRFPLNSLSQRLRPWLERLAGRLSFDGQLDYAQTDAGFSLRQTGNTRLQSLDTSLDHPRIHVGTRSANLKTNLHYATGKVGHPLQLTADIRLNKTGIVTRGSQLKLLQAGTLQFSGLRLMDSDHLFIQTIDAHKLELARRIDNSEAGAYMDVDAISVSSLRYANRLVSIDKVRYRGGHSHMQRDRRGNWRIVGILDTLHQLATANKTQPTVPDTRPLAVRINRIDVTDNSTLSIVDNHVEPAYRVTLDVSSASLTSLDTRRPAQNSPITLQAGIGKHTKLSLHGHIQPLMSPIRLGVEAQVQALNLPPLSPYTRKSLGLVMDSGNLDADLHLQVSEKQMDGKVSLKLYQLALKHADSKHGLQALLPVPLDVALDALRDSHNTIKLKIPVKGDPANPDFSMDDILNQALAKGLRKGALTYLTLALQPYGSLITVARYAGELITKVRLKPVDFEAGKTAIDATDKDYLGKVAKVLKERPKLAIKLCGVAVQADIDQLRQKNKPPAISQARLQSLAQARADGVRDYLVDTFRIPADHLVSCQPRIETGDKQQAPRTDLLI